ncbi:amidase activator ActS [Cedecea neteri]|uniref:amidase activator ActS n=1 Tax=Cedecea neteri TaxID=158822 RepID=UPI002AA9082A|nr:amidase activator ActS [Cedecea neteri]WPU23794.1 amidase activator ActS [Cedecea neteri]
MPGCIALLAACLLLAGCSSKSPSSKEGTFSGAVYTVKRGDTLSKISRMTGSSVGDLARLNGIPAPYTIQVGQRIRIKGSGSASRPKNTATAKNTAPARSQNTTIAKVAPPPVGARCWLWPTKGNIVEPFSSSDGGNKGIDISGSRGQPIYASGAGTVVYVGNQLRGYGNLVMIKHSEEYITAYAHTDTMLVNTGEKVKAGQKIATMGSTGADSVRLHFQIRYRATAIDPQRYLKPSC